MRTGWMAVEGAMTDVSARPISSSEQPSEQASRWAMKEARKYKFSGRVTVSTAQNLAARLCALVGASHRERSRDIVLADHKARSTGFFFLRHHFCGSGRW